MLNGEKYSGVVPIEEIKYKSPKFLDYCRVCKRKHIMEQLPCPSCGIYYVPQPSSEKVRDNCGADYACDGCIAYREHTNCY